MSKIRSAQAVLNEIRDGKAVGELSEAFHDAIAAVREHGKPATVTLVVTIAPFKGQHKLIEPPVVLTAEVTSKLPKAEPEATIFFVDKEGNPTRTQEREPELGLSIAGAQQPTGTEE